MLPHSKMNSYLLYLQTSTVRLNNFQKERCTHITRPSHFEVYYSAQGTAAEATRGWIANFAHD